jgi:hypothetical protein
VADEIKCVLSGRYALDEEYDVGDPFPFARNDPMPAARSGEDDAEGPLNWLRVTVERRILNPAWVDFQEVKAIMIEGQIMGLPKHRPDKTPISDDERATAGRAIKTGTDAALFGLEDATPKYIVVEDEVWISPPSSNPSVLDAWSKIAAVLEFPKDEAPDEEDEE